MPWRREHDENSILISDLNAPPSTDDRDNTPDLGDFQSAGEILGASGELLAHFHRSGLRFLPKQTVDPVAKWSETLSSGFTVVSNSGAVAEPAPPATAEPTPAGHAAQTPPTPVTPATPVTPSAPSPAAGRLSPVASAVVSSAPYPVALPVAEVVANLDSLATRVAGCTRCKTLASCRTQTVFGEGHPQPRFVFFGEAPGAEEDKSGRPFVGAAGQLLTKMIEAIQLKREDVYLLNTVKCRPPGNRNPAPDEVANCREYFQTQLQLLRPEYIVCLGAVSSQALLQSKLSIGRLRQTFHQYHDSKVLAIYHPSYLLRNPDAKRAAWADLQLLMKDAGL